MNIPKNHKEYTKTVYIYFDSYTKEQAYEQIELAFDKAEKDGVLEPTLSFSCDSYYGDCEHDWYIKGYVPMTEKEIEQAETRRKAESAMVLKKKQEKLEAEKKEIKRLAKKFKIPIPEGSLD